MQKTFRILSGVFAILFILTVIYNKYESNRAEENSKRLLSSYISEITSELTTESEYEQTSEYNETVSEIASNENMWLDAADYPINISTDMVIGVLSIPSISLNMPVINITTDELLTVSLCRYNTTNIGSKVYNNILEALDLYYMSNDFFKTKYKLKK